MIAELNRNTDYRAALAHYEADGGAAPVSAFGEDADEWMPYAAAIAAGAVANGDGLAGAIEGAASFAVNESSIEAARGALLLAGEALGVTIPEPGWWADN